MRIDVHADLVPCGLPDLATATGDLRWPKLIVDGGDGRILAEGRVYREVDEQYWSTSRRLELMDDWGIDRQIVSPLPVLLPFWADASFASKWCRAVNVGIAEAVTAGGDRFRGLGILPAQDLDASIAELAHVRELGLVGIELGTALDDEHTVGHEPARGLLTYLTEEDVPTLVHPVQRGLVRGLDGVLDPAVGLPIDTTLALLPRLWPLNEDPMPRACVVHGGGTLPWAWPRVRALGGQPDAELPPWFHVDTAAVDRGQLEYLIGMLGPDRVIFGTDCPASSSASIESQVEMLDDLGDIGLALASTNAERFFELAV